MILGWMLKQQFESEVEKYLRQFLTENDFTGKLTMTNYNEVMDLFLNSIGVLIFTS